MITLQTIQKEGFAKVNFGEIPSEFHEFIKSLPFKESGMEAGTQASFKYSMSRKKSFIETALFDWFLEGFLVHAQGDHHLMSLLPYMHIGIDKSVKGDWIMPHTDIAYSGLVQAAYFFSFDEFEGREFVYGTEDKFETFKPDNKHGFFIETTNKKFIHGVKELTSDSVVYSVGIYPVPPGGRNEQLILRDELTPKWELTNECQSNEIPLQEKRAEDGPRILQSQK